MDAAEHKDLIYRNKKGRNQEWYRCFATRPEANQNARNRNYGEHRRIKDSAGYSAPEV